MTQTDSPASGVHLSDLHRHLDGSIRPQTVHDIAEQLGTAVPSDLLFSPGLTLSDALSKFRFTLSLLREPELVRRVANEICEDAAGEGVTTLEIRFAPHLHSTTSPELFVDAALDGIAGRAGLILCGLYGDSPQTINRLVELAESRMGVVGIDIAGAPSAVSRFSLADYISAFSRARDLGLGRTVHAGEGRPPSEIRDAIELLHANRIGHGTTLLDDSDVLDLVLRRGVVIETCLTSNMHTGVVDSIASHPLPAWIAHGVKATLCTDNTLLSGVTITMEEEAATKILRISDSALESLRSNGRNGAFKR